MTNEMIDVCGTEISIKEYKGQRVVTFKDIDRVHKRPEGTARKRFNDNKRHFIEGEDYFKICASEIRTHKIMELSEKAREDVTLITESGYLMLVKSFTDDLAWKVQRQLVQFYFNVREFAQKQLLSIEDAFKVAELINNTPSDRLALVTAVFQEAGIHIPKNNDFCVIKKSTRHTDIEDFLQSVDVTNQPTSNIYNGYLNYCSAYRCVPVSKITFSKLVNKALGTHIIQKKINKVNHKVFVY